MIWLLLAVLVWGGIHSALATTWVKERVYSLVGEWGRRLYRLGYNLWAGISFLPILYLAYHLPDEVIYQVPLPWWIPMVLGEILATLALLIGFFQVRPMEFLGICQLGSPIEEPHSLRVDGLNRFVRHPLYTAGLVFIWLMPVMTTNSLGISLGLTLYVIAGAYLEEGRLIHEFGQEYREYMRETPMFIPFLKGTKSAGRRLDKGSF
jgi:methanethiol S-methyltransferase